MSQRSIRRAQQRRVAAEQRRESLRRRRALLATGAVIGATALFAPAALGAEFRVTELGDAGDNTCDATCTLRDAFIKANADPRGDRITFASNVTGTIRLTQGELQADESEAIDESLTIDGPGASALTISGDANGDGIANAGDVRILRLTNGDPVTVSGLTLSGGFAEEGGAVGVSLYSDLRLVDAVVTGNVATAGGGAISASGDVTVTRSVLTGNSSEGGGGGAILFDPGITWSGTPNGSRLTVTDSTISGNSASMGGGGIDTYGPATVTGSTISGNVAHSGAGVQVGTNRLSRPGYAPPGSIEIRNSTIASNTAAGSGGGIRLEAYPEDPNDSSSDQISATIPLTSTIVADNAPQDLERAPGSTSGGFDLSFSLVELPGNAPLFQHAERPSIIGQDPQLGPLADNGGPTFTHLPAPTSPAVEHGSGDPAATDQRGLARVVDGEGDNAPGGNGADIGAVELQDPPAKPMPGGPDVTPPGDLPPQAVITSNGLAAKRDRGRVVAGTASDDKRVAAVDVAIVRKHGRLCKQLKANGRFTKAARCSGPKVFLRANGTTKWRFRLTHRLGRGGYVVYSRATDDAGQTQLTFGPKSRRSFRVRPASSNATPHTAICAADFADVVDCR